MRLRHTPSAFAALATCAVLLLAAPAVRAADFSLQGQLGVGPLTGRAFSGSFSVNTASLTPTFEGELPLAAFSLQLGSQLYTLASADFTPTAVYAQGQFVGLAYVDADAPDIGLRPQFAFVPGFDSFAGAYAAYVTTADAAGASAGFGSYSVALVPEPASLALWLGGLAGLAGLARIPRARRGATGARRCRQA